MRTELALRYLLLRHLKAIARSAPSGRFEEVARSLRIEIEGDQYAVSWSVDGETRAARFPRSHFAFYERGDSRPAERSPDDDLRTANDARAREWALAALDVPPPPPAGREPIEAYRWFAVGEAVLLALGLWLTKGLELPAAVLLLALLLLEHRPHGRLWACGLLLPLALVAPPIPAALMAGALAGLQFLDPDGAQRGLRVLACTVAAVVAGLGIEVPDPSPGALPTLALGAAALWLVLHRSLRGSHRRASPLALPLFCWGLVLEGHGLAGTAGLGWLLLATLAFGRLPGTLPVQRERTLTPNG